MKLYTQQQALDIIEGYCRDHWSNRFLGWGSYYKLHCSLCGLSERIVRSFHLEDYLGVMQGYF